MNTNSGNMHSTLNLQRIPLWQVFTVLALILMDLSWISAAFTLLVETQLDVHAGRVFLVLGLIYLATYLVASAFQYLELDDGIVQLLLLAIAIAGLLWAAGNLIYHDEGLSIAGVIGRYLSSFKNLSVLFKPEFLLTITVIAFWRRGLSIGRPAAGPRFIRRAFNTGILAFLVIIIVAAGLGRSLPMLGAALFLFSGLMAMGSARLSSLSRSRGGRGIPFERERVAGLTLLASGMLVFAGGMGLLAGGPLSVWLSDILSTLGGFVLRVLFLILGPFIYLFARALGWVMGFIQGLPPESMELFDTGMQEALESFDDIQTVAGDSQVGSILSTILAVGSLLFLFWIFFYTVRRYRSGNLTRIPDEGDEIRISGSISDYLRALLRGRAKRAIEGISRLNPAARFIAAARIRQIYASLLRLSARLGEPRSPSDTPLEFMGTLERIFPASRVELATITHAYLRVRYGELPETRMQVDEVESAWEFVRKRGRPDEETG
jgi:hypothetical protein